MKVIKNINNNIAICLDSNGTELVAFGKGIGFSKPPYEVELSKIERTYYNIDSSFIGILNDISETALKISGDVIDYAKELLNTSLNTNIILTLADHIDFAIRRYKENINVNLSISNDIKHLYEKEIKIGYFALDLISKETGVELNDNEATHIALHIINSEFFKYDESTHVDNDIIEDVVQIIEHEFKLTIDTESFSYSRFVSHMYYILKRIEKNSEIKSENLILYKSLVNSFPKTSQCVQIIKVHLAEKYSLSLSDEECLYLILHVNRLCIREENAN